jgi:hypothetical protein
MWHRAVVLLLSCATLVVAASCAASGTTFARGLPTREAGAPVLVGTLVDGDGHILPRVDTSLNLWYEIGLSGGIQVVTDHEGRFRIDLPSSFLEASSKKRTVGLVGAGGTMAVFDARCAFSAGVRDIGDLLMAHPADTHALWRLTDDALISRLNLLAHWSSDAFDACLRECARRGGQRIVSHLEHLEQQQDDTTNTALATARNRAERQADPLVLEARDGVSAPLSCVVGDLPIVRLALVNRDPLGRNIRLRCREPEGHDESLAVDCCSVGPGPSDFSLLRPSQEGLRWSGAPYELAPGEEVVVSIRLSHYVRIASPGRYELRLAFRMNGSWDLDEGSESLPCGVLFNYSQPFLVDVR